MDSLLKSHSEEENKIKLLEEELTYYKSRDILHDNFEYFFNETSDLVCIANLDGYFLKINDAFTKTLGYSEQDLITKQLINFVHPNDVSKTIQELTNLKNGLNTLNFGNRYLKKDGGIMWLQWIATINTKTKIVFAIARDVTEIKKTQEKLTLSEKLLNESQKMAKIGSWHFDVQTNELLWSDEMYNIFEIDRKTKDVYKKFLERLSIEGITTIKYLMKLSTSSHYQKIKQNG